MSNARNRIDSVSPIIKKITEVIGKFIENVTIANKTISGEAISSLMFEKYQISISKSYVNCYRRSIGLRFLPQIKAFLLTPEQRGSRIEFAKRNANNTFENVLFTDESYFELDCLQWIWRRKGEISENILNE